jgi:hypothetical protein
MLETGSTQMPGRCSLMLCHVVGSESARASVGMCEADIVVLILQLHQGHASVVPPRHVESADQQEDKYGNVSAYHHCNYISALSFSGILLASSVLVRQRCPGVSAYAHNATISIAS